MFSKTAEFIKKKKKKSYRFQQKIIHFQYVPIIKTNHLSADFIKLVNENDSFGGIFHDKQ